MSNSINLLYFLFINIKFQSNSEQCIVFGCPVIMIILISLLLLILLGFVLIVTGIFSSLLNWMIFRLFVNKLIFCLLILLVCIRNIFFIWQSQILLFFFIFTVKWLFTEWTFSAFEVGFFFEYFPIQRMLRCELLLLLELIRFDRIWRGELMILRDVISEIDFEGDFIKFRKFLFRRSSCENIVQKHYSPVYFYIFVFIN